MSDSPASILYDASGNPIKVITHTDRYIGAGIVQDVIQSTVNSSDVNLASGASFTGTAASTLGVAAIQVSAIADQPIRVSVQQSIDGSNWDLQDTFDLPPSASGGGDGRTVQAIMSQFRIVVTNLGPAITTVFRVQTFLRPTAEVLPNALTPRGALKLSKQTQSFQPDPANFSSFTVMPSLLQDIDGHLATRGPVMTDEKSFRDDFSVGGALYSSLTGTCYFRNGSDHVTGIGTSFLDEVLVDQYIKLSTDSDAFLTAISDVYSDTDLVLTSPYGGSTGSGTGDATFYTYDIGSGGSISITSSEMRLASGTTSGIYVTAKRAGDYPPYIVGSVASISQRIADQEAMIGLMDNDYGSIAKQACVVFDGTDNTKVKLRTGFDTSDTKETTVTLPNGAVTSSMNTYQLEVTTSKVVLWVNEVRLAEHNLHIPGPYDPMDVQMIIANTGAAASSTTLSVDAIWFMNFNRVDVGLTPQGEPVSVELQKSTTPTCTNVAAAVADTLLLAANANRLGAAIFNSGAAFLYLKFGSGSSPTSYTVRMAANSYYEVPFGYTGAIYGYWSAIGGAARVTEVV